MDVDQIKFRGKRLDTGEWTYGNLLCGGRVRREVAIRDPLAETAHDDTHQVDFETVGQYTGLRDSNFEDVYGDDIWLWKGQQYLVQWTVQFAGFSLVCIENDGPATGLILASHLMSQGKIVGNIYDNPELLK